MGKEQGLRLLVYGVMHMSSNLDYGLCHWCAGI